LNVPAFHQFLLTGRFSAAGGIDASQKEFELRIRQSFASLDHSLDAAVDKVKVGLNEMFPKTIPRAGPGDNSSPEATAIWNATLTASTILGAQVLKHAMQLKTAKEPCPNYIDRALANTLAAVVKARLEVSKLDDCQISLMNQELSRGSKVSNLQLWMIPHLLQCCGLKRERAEGVQLEVWKMLEKLVDKLDEFPEIGEPNQKPTSRKQKHWQQREMGY
jgi:hypothetical protein